VGSLSGQQGFSGGARPQPKSLRAATGLTLIELLVVLVLIGVLAGVVSVSGVPGTRSGLAQEADRLAQLLGLARDEAQVRGVPVRFEPSEEGYRFLLFRDREWRMLQDDTDLRARRWSQPTELRIDRPDGAQRIEFGRDAVDAPFTIHLKRGSIQLELIANGLGEFRVQP